jgi:hypothetical protein
MPARFEQLREAIANLAASADVQAAYLDRVHSPLTGGGSAAGYGNDELALEFDDIFHAAGHMVDAGELTPWQRDAAVPLDAILNRWSGQSHAAFWKREALWSDPRWEEVRSVAKEALTAFTQ